jgi:hypothetical protein
VEKKTDRGSDREVGTDMEQSENEVAGGERGGGGGTTAAATRAGTAV